MDDETKTEVAPLDPGVCWSLGQGEVFQLFLFSATCSFSGFDLKLFYSFSCFSMCGNTKSPNLTDET